MRKRSWVIALVACSVLAASCSPGARSSEYQRQIAAESLALERSPDTVYRRRMRDFIALSRAVPTDSLARLFARLARATKEEQPALRQATICELEREMLIARPDVYERAHARMLDSLERAGVDVARSKVVLDAGAGPPLEISETACPGLPESTWPDSLHVTPKPSSPH